MPGARLRALDLLASCGHSVWTVSLSHNNESDEETYKEFGSIIAVKKAFNRLLEEEITAAGSSSDGYWESELLQRLKDTARELRYHWGPLGGYHRDRDQSIIRATALLIARHSQCVAKILVMKVAGHRLSPELVLLIEECLVTKVGIRDIIDGILASQVRAWEADTVG